MGGSLPGWGGRGPTARNRAGPESWCGPWPLVGRADELDYLADAVTEGSRSAVVAGGAGVGKSRLLSAFVERASRRGARTVLVRATRSTATIPFGPFAAWTPESSGLATTDRLQVLRATARALLGGDGRTVVTVDDAHLLDEGSAALILHIATQTPAGVVVATRTGERGPDAVVALWKEGLADRLELQPLSEPETAELSERALGGGVDPSARQRLWQLTGGTPLYLREVLHAAVAQGVLTLEAGRWRWRGDLAGGGRLGELLDGRLADVGPSERRTLELVATGEPLPVEVVAELGCLEPLAAVERRGLVVIGGDDQELMVRLAHPLYGEVLRTDLPRLVAGRHQQALATAAVAAGWHERDPLRVAAWWLDGGAAASGPADVFVAAARRALSLGEWSLADRLGRAAEGSGAGPEAALIRAAALVHLGGWGHVEQLLADVPTDGLDDEMVAEHARLRAGFLSWSRQGRPAAGRDVLVDAADRLSAPARSRALGEAAYIALAAEQLEDAAALAIEAMNDAGPSTDLRVRAMAVAALASMIRGQTGAALRVAEMASPFVAAAVAADPYPDNPAGVMGAAHCLALVLDGRIDAAGSQAEAALEPLEQYDVEARRTVCAAVAGRIALLQGRLALARQRGQTAVADAGPGPGSQWPAAVLATAAAQLGAVAVAEEALRHADAATPAIPLYAHELALGRCWLLAARGEIPAAQELVRRTATGAAEAGVWLFEMLALLDLARLGAPEHAAARLAHLSQLIDGPYAAAAACYARAAAEGNGDALDDVSSRFEAMGALLLAAEAAAGAAVAHRASGRFGKERGSLARARVLAIGCDGARTPALGQVDAVPAVEALTRREREVVDLAARGFTNREIAAHLYVSIRTVNAHLGHAYTKLGTNDRRELAVLLPSGAATAPGSSGPSGPSEPPGGGPR